MSQLNPILAVVIHCTLFLSSLTGNVFILTVHFADWLKTREFNPCDVIINCIVLSNVLLQGTVLINEICFFMFVVYYFQDKVLNVMGAMMASLAFSSLWCSTCLCFYYCVKIIQLSGTFFYKVQAKLPVVVPYLLALSVAISWMVGLPAYWQVYTYMAVTNDSIPGNLTLLGNLTLPTTFNIKSRCNCLFQMYMLFAAVAFIIIFITAGTIITSLYRHMKRLRQNSKSFGNAKIKSHISAARTVSSLLLIYLAFYGALTGIFNETAEVGTLLFSFCFVVISTFPTINAIILITGNRKLLNAVKHLLGIKHSADCPVSNAANL